MECFWLMDYLTVGDQGMGHFKVAFILVEIDESKKREHSWCFQQRGFNIRIGMLSKMAGHDRQGAMVWLLLGFWVHDPRLLLFLPIHSYSLIVYSGIRKKMAHSLVLSIVAPLTEEDWNRGFRRQGIVLTPVIESVFSWKTLQLLFKTNHLSMAA